MDHIGLKPAHILGFGEAVGLGRRLAGVDGRPQEAHRARQVRVVVFRHQRDHGQHDGARLTDRQHIRLRADHADNAAHRLRIFIQTEPAETGRHHARVGPVGDVNFVRREERLDRAAQQRRVMPGQRRYDQHARIRVIGGALLSDARPRQSLRITLEVQERAPRFLGRFFNRDRDGNARNRGAHLAPFGLTIIAGDGFKDIRGGGGLPAEFRARERV